MKFVHSFGAVRTDGSAKDKNLLGGKGANLAEMTSIGIPVPPGFTIDTETCVYYMNNGSYQDTLDAQVKDAIALVEEEMCKKFGDADDPLLFSVRSGARMSMPGMMETVLNVGLTSSTIPGAVKASGNERFVWDSYRRLIMMYSDVVMEKAAGIEPADGEGIRVKLEEIMEKLKASKGYKLDTEMSADDLKLLVDKFKAQIKKQLGKEFPDDHYEQLWGGITAVFRSWNGKRAVNYRKIENIPDNWGTAVNVQTMVFGNYGEDSATGVAFTRDPGSGADTFFGEWLVNAQGEDVVAGIRDVNPINNSTKNENNAHLESLEDAMPDLYKQLDDIQNKLEEHYSDMQDIEFTIQDKKLWMLQTRTGKRTGAASIRMAVEMLEEGMINDETALLRVDANKLNEVMLPQIESDVEKAAAVLAKGLPAGPGAACGQIVFTADDAEAWKAEGKTVILVRDETSPEDVHGMHAAAAILTSKGGMTSHAALVARGWGKCCIVGCAALDINTRAKTLTIGDKVFKEGDMLTLNGSRGIVYGGNLQLVDADLDSNHDYTKLMEVADKKRRLLVRTNADRPEDAALARKFGAEGIGLCRTEHMFFDPERITAMREMIVAENSEDRDAAVMKLLPFQREDFYGILKAMAPQHVTVRLLDPPLHEFITLDKEQRAELAKELDISEEKLQKRIDSLHELNPMLGHRGCRLGVAYPVITEMQSRAIFEATVQLIKEGEKPFPEVMIPLVGSVTELRDQRARVVATAEKVMEETGSKFEYMVGTMIELPRACVTADEIAGEAEFFSFGTNDLTQTTYGFSRDDIGGFLPIYLENRILDRDPFASIDQTGVGGLVDMAVKKGRDVKNALKIGICGEHGGDPDSIDFFHRSDLNYVSCSPFRVPIARLAAAQAAVRNK